MNQNDFYARLDALMDSESTFDLIPSLIVQASTDGLSILVAFEKNPKGESVAAYGMLQDRMFLLCAPKWVATGYEAYTLAETEINRLSSNGAYWKPPLQAHRSHRWGAGAYRAQWA